MLYNGVVVIGASRGFGREFCLSYARKFLQEQPNEKLNFFLLARDIAALNQTSQEIQTLTQAKGISVESFSVDLSSSQFDQSESFTRFLSSFSLFLSSNTTTPSATTPISTSASPIRICLVLNSGSMGPLTHAIDVSSIEWTEALQSNFISITQITKSLVSSIQQYSRQNHNNNSTKIPLTIVNISSLLAHVTCSPLSVYHVTKSARENFLKAFIHDNDQLVPSKLNSNGPNVPSSPLNSFISAKVLNYAPGPMDTKLVQDMRQTIISSQAKQYYDDLDKGLSGGWVNITETANKLTFLITQNFDQWKNGDHIDFYDQLPSTTINNSTTTSNNNTNNNNNTPVVSDKDKLNNAPAPIVRFSRTEKFCSHHSMSNPSLTEEQNKALFGKCFRDHGHNYTVELMYEGPLDPISGMIVDLNLIKQTAESVINQMDHHSLNSLENLFLGRPTSAEVIAVVFWEQIYKSIGSAKLIRVRVHETDKQFAEYKGPRTN